MKRVLSFFAKYSLWESDAAAGPASGPGDNGFGLPAPDLSGSLAKDFAWIWFFALTIVLLLLLLAWMLRVYIRLKEHLDTYRRCSADQLRFIRSLLDLCYAYRESPQVFLDKFKDKVNIREMKAYDLLGHGNDRRWKNLKEDERLLCMLLERGFTQRELCVVFNMKTINNLYIKHHRIRKKLAGHSRTAPPATPARTKTARKE